MGSGVSNHQNKIRELTECSICMEAFVDPQKLPCDHSFCAGCVEPLKQGSRIECPLCRAVHDVSRIRSDFRTQQIVDALKFETKPKDTKTKGNFLQLFCRTLTRKILIWIYM